MKYCEIDCSEVTFPLRGFHVDYNETSETVTLTLEGANEKTELIIIQKKDYKTANVPK